MTSPVRCNFTATTDLTTACTPALESGGCLFFTLLCRTIKARNTALLSHALEEAPPGTTLWVPPGQYHLDAGVYAESVVGVTLLLAGNLTQVSCVEPCTGLAR